ncbi:hypothetical protein SHM_26520 [Spiroplasma ixodetis]|uniref:Uncharacterized protein n=1 Tax=Spiroplasma ixodetis TaxID=2141 RepID=A0ABN6T4G2_9MOLU|nr:hypothetical protein SHM_26520 [Spiroplasma ixodetis]
MLTHENNFKYSYEKPDHSIVFGKYPIWVDKTTSSDVFSLYFSSVKQHKVDIEWDGKYPNGYFDW